MLEIVKPFREAKPVSAGTIEAKHALDQLMNEPEALAGDASEIVEWRSTIIIL